MLTMSHCRFVVVGRRPGLTSRRYAVTIAEAAGMAQEMEDHYSLVSIKKNLNFVG